MQVAVHLSEVVAEPRRIYCNYIYSTVIKIRVFNCHAKCWTEVHLVSHEAWGTPWIYLWLTFYWGQCCHESKAHTSSLLSLAPPHPTNREFPKKMKVPIDGKFCLYLIATEIEFFLLDFSRHQNSHGQSHWHITEILSWDLLWIRDQLSSEFVMCCIVQFSLNVWAGHWKLWRAEYIDKY